VCFCVRFFKVLLYCLFSCTFSMCVFCPFIDCLFVRFPVFHILIYCLFVFISVFNLSVYCVSKCPLFKIITLLLFSCPFLMSGLLTDLLSVLLWLGQLSVFLPVLNYCPIVVFISVFKLLLYVLSSCPF